MKLKDKIKFLRTFPELKEGDFSKFSEFEINTILTEALNDSFKGRNQQGKL